MADSLLEDQPALIAFQLVPILLLPYHDAAKARNKLRVAQQAVVCTWYFDPCFPLQPSMALPSSIIWCSSITWASAPSPLR